MTKDAGLSSRNSSDEVKIGEAADYLENAVNSFGADDEGLILIAEHWNRMRQAIITVLPTVRLRSAPLSERPLIKTQRILDEPEIKALCKKLRLPKYWWDTEEGRMNLARFANEVVSYERK